MSVPNQTPYNTYTANGLTTVFAYEFYLISASDIQVTINGSIVTSGYTVSGVGNIDGGDITFLTPPANTSVVLLERVVPTYRLTDYQDNGDLLADTVNKDFDRLWMAIQRAFFDLGFALTRPFWGGPFNAKGYRIENLGDPVNDQDAATKKFVISTGKINLARTLRVPENSVDELPSVTARRNSLLGWNNWGKPVPIFAMTETADLAIKLASSEDGLGDSLVTHVKDGVFTGSLHAFLNSTIQYVTPELMGYKASNASDDNAAAIFDALTIASANNLVCKFQNGIYNSNDVEINFPVSIDVSPGSLLDFTLVIRGGYFNAVSKVETTLDWESVPAGTTAIAGDFSSFTVGGVAAVKLQDSDGGSATVGNETGFDFSVISAKSSSSLTLTTPLRLPYRNPDVSYISNAVQFAGSMSSGDYYITGDFTSMFVAGDVLRVENIDSATGVEASKFYFEYVKIREITTDGISLKARLNYNHTNPWLVKTMFIKEPTITGGGRIKRLEIRQCDSPRVQNLSIDRLIVGNCYDSTTANINSVGVNDPSTMNHSFCFGRSSVSNVRVGGSYATFDNAACKFMTCPMMQVSNVTSDNTTATGTQGDFGLFVDAFFTPYLGWNTGMSINDIKVERPRSPVNRAVWFYGMKNSTVTNVTGGEVFIQGNVSSTFMGINIPDEPLESRDLVGCVVSGLCKSSRILGCVDTDFSLKTTGLGSGYSLNIACFLGSGIKNPNTGVSYTIGSNNKVDINSLSESASAVTIYAQSQNNLLFGSGCRDKSTVASSITLGTLITNPGMQPNRLNGSIGAGSGWTGVRIKGGIAFDGNYADGYIVINGRYLWVSSDNKLKMSLTKPDADSPSGQIIIGP